MWYGLRRRVSRIRRDIGRAFDARPEPTAARALAWIRANHLPTGGIRVESRHPRAYPEVTGYLIPTLLEYGERDLAIELTNWLLCIQRSDGSFADPDTGRSFVFDTGQALRGLLAAIGVVDGADRAARRAAEYLCASSLQAGGFSRSYGGTNCPEAVHLYVLPPLMEAATRLGCQQFRALANQCLEHYLRAGDSLRIDDLTHFLCYELEALIDLGRTDLARPVLNDLSRLQAADGSVRGTGGATWICTPGLAQLAICWYKCGMIDAADRAMTWLDAHQERDGGFLGSYGAGASYKQDVEISWAAKFVLDAHLRRIRAFFARHASEFPSAVAPDDGRAQAVLRHVGRTGRVVEVGCGKGRFLKVVAAKRSGVTCCGVDPSPELLASVPAGIETTVGSLERVPHPDDAFDVAFAVESLEHSVAPQRAVAELVRVTKPGGWVVIVDKHDGAWGRLACPPWERWPEIETLASELRERCDDVSSELIPYDGRPASDGLMVAWSGRKRARLSGDEWHAVLVSSDLERTQVDEVRFGHFSEWGRTVVRQTEPGQRVLEIGSGTGKISLQLALAGRQVTCLDSSADSLRFVERCAASLDVSLSTIRADATQPLPFRDRFFDCVWSSGLLEHFTAAERRAMLRDWARVCRGRVVSLVPNAAAVAYRFGKSTQEREGVWPYGLEVPLLSLRDDYEAAGLVVREEFSVAPQHALNFVHDGAIRRAIKRMLAGVSAAELRSWQQGYLLVTVGGLAQSPR
jgi:ubiquinone/menaquinone biosynthesis C-methylase UbiE